MALRQKALLIPLIFILSPRAFGRTYDMYRADYAKGAFCATIGGACASDDNLENSFFQNPAALIAHGADWNFDGDFNSGGNLEPGMKNSNQISESTFMGGMGFAGDQWGIGIALSGRNTQVQSSAEMVDDSDNRQVLSVTTKATTVQANLPIAYRLNKQLSVGIALVALHHAEDLTIPSGGASAGQPAGYFDFGASAGAIYEASPFLRLGSWFRTSLISYETYQIHTQAFANQFDYTEEIALSLPWVWATGLSLMPWKDEHTLLMDLDLIGSTTDGYLLTYDNFAAATKSGKLQPKGRSLAVEPHLGWRAPWKQNLGSYMLGAYLENGRTDGINGRWHTTAGFSYKAFSWMELMVGADVASNYFQFLFTFR